MNTTKLSTFDFNDSPVRALLDQDGEPWFVAADVCRVLELGNTTEAMRPLDEDDLSTTEVIDSLGRSQTANIISEAGLYQLVLVSRKTEARKFKRWVTKEVLPSIRKTGSFGMGIDGLSAADETKIRGILDELESAIRAKRAGTMSNSDASTLANLTCQYLKGWELVLRPRTKTAAALPAKGEA
jgi:prophage antirepressor-like protein